MQFTTFAIACLAFTGTPVVSKLYLMIPVSEKLNGEQEVKLVTPIFRDRLKLLNVINVVDKNLNKKFCP